MPIDNKKLVSKIEKQIRWFETMEQGGFLGGPVVHIWGNSLDYCGPGLDWRYEGYLSGMVKLYRQTGDHYFLDKITNSLKIFENFQYKNGAFRCSHFQSNPINYGTPHEVAALIGLIHCADLLKNENPEFFDKAREITLNYLNNFLIKYLWNPVLGGFVDWPYSVFNLFTYNKNSTVGLFLIMASRTFKIDLDYYIEKLAKRFLLTPTLYPQTEGKYENLYIPYYNARCVPFLVELSKYLNDPAYFKRAQDICAHIANSFLDLDYAQGFALTTDNVGNAKIKNVLWVAASGDILSAFLSINQLSVYDQYINWLLDKQLESGGFPTFIREDGSYDLLDIVPVTGWNDKMFNFLTDLAQLEKNDFKNLGSQHSYKLQNYPLCGGKYFYAEDNDSMVLKTKNSVVFSWTKNNIFSSVNKLEPRKINFK
ncbi:MAG: hypothetical protein A2538_04760 [Candidatus Magasanikbacteria bacterium RIFOXYD2_FULL_41_14]|uniref:Linalool dehydratase/isomerase domain-containing protein n=1 Tax=Candidatus Magasanikbacteria bacterium RIFOXYD2_FULL_41_14 TaxID=1798709 RepID=A0A1F6PFN7_9BACT|nr:MAG: hypothetical protein A2538_04760 [Candidatus Magasanikbacteria bacterium RIFOXYD2_FULL_41_14]